MTASALYLVRHGEVHNPDRLRYGRTPGFRLSERGRREVDACATWLGSRGSSIDLIASSPLERAVETAQRIRERLGLSCDVRGDERLIEARSRFDGLRYRADLWAHVARWFSSDNTDEPSTTVAARVREALSSISAETRGAAIIVSHQLPIQYVQLALERRGPVRPWHRRPPCATASVTVLVARGGALRVSDYWSPASETASDR